MCIRDSPQRVRGVNHLRDGVNPIGAFVKLLGREKARELLVKHGIKGVKQELPGGSVEYSIFDPSILTVESAP